MQLPLFSGRAPRQCLVTDCSVVAHRPGSVTLVLGEVSRSVYMCCTVKTVVGLGLEVRLHIRPLQFIVIVIYTDDKEQEAKFSPCDQLNAITA